MDYNTIVSVIMPVYNVAPYLSESLESVIGQTYESLEIIIIDDGSVDGSGEICDKYASEDCRIRLIHQENRGLSAARNLGLDIMTGEVVAFIDSDDAYSLNYIKRLLETMVNTRADIVMCKYTIHNTD